MKAEPVLYYSGALSIELVGETDFEVSLLHKAFEAGHMKRGNGSSITRRGGSTGFYIDVPVAGARIDPT